jgi:hypothetical protein
MKCNAARGLTESAGLAWMVSPLPQGPNDYQISAFARPSLPVVTAEAFDWVGGHGNSDSEDPGPAP